MTDLYTRNTGYNINTVNSGKNGSKTPAAALAITAGLIGAGAGAATKAIRKTPVVNADGIAGDTFVKNVYTKYVKKTTDEELKLFEKQRSNIMEKIGKTNNGEDLKNLLNENKELADKILAPSGMTTDSYGKSLSKGIKKFFIKKDKKNIQRGVENAYEMRLNDLSCKISESWNATNKKFEKIADVPEELYNAIKKTTRGMQAKEIAKAAGITGLIAGAGTFIVVKIVELIKNRKPSVKTASPNVTY